MNAAELTDSLAEAWDALLHTPLFGIALTLALAEGPKTGAFSALAMACSGVLTALLAPLVLAMTG